MFDTMVEKMEPNDHIVTYRGPLSDQTLYVTRIEIGTNDAIGSHNEDRALVTTKSIAAGIAYRLRKKGFLDAAAIAIY